MSNSVRNLLLLLAFLLPNVARAQYEYPLDLNKIGVSLPATTDSELSRLFESKRTIFYKLAPVWQHYIPAGKVEHINLVTGVKSYTHTKAVWGLFYAPFLADYNANPLFPWDTTAGLNESQKKTPDIYRTFNFLNLPDSMPILLINERPVKWVFPEFATVGEVIYVMHNGKPYIQEVRTRQKSMGSVDWTPHLYRPIADRQEYIQAAGIADYVPAKRYVFLRNPQEDEVFKMEGLVERLPPLSEDKVKILLGMSFKEVTESEWSPSADQDFHILPRNYCFSLLKSIDPVTCSDCHRQTQTSVNNLVPLEPLIQESPEKVGNIRGCDAVFTWHPFAPHSIRNSDKEPTPKTSVRQFDRENNIVRVWDGKELPPGYKLTEFVQDSLKGYELPPQQFLHSAEFKMELPK